MRWVFWVSLGFIAYACAGFPFWLFLRSRWRRRSVHAAPIFPRVSIVMAVHNEAQALPQKLHNLLELDYPRDQCEIIVVSDGSTDATNTILEESVSERLLAFTLPQHQGKAVALNRGIAAARGEIVVFTDARQQIEPEAVRNLVANFADPRVGCVSGELMLEKPGEAQSVAGVGLYWRFEKLIRQWESDSGAVVGATGALYAVRKKWLVSLPPGTLLDDVYQPLHVARQGGRVIFEPSARAWDSVSPSGKEFRRKVRTLMGNYQLLQLAPWVLTRANPLRFEFVCHKLLRLFVPFALMGVLVSSLLAPGFFYRIAALLQIVFYALAILALGQPRFGILTRLADISLAFLLLNVAAAVALFYFVTGKRRVWVRSALP